MAVREVDFGKQDVQAEIVELLEGLLEIAQEGGIQAIVIGTRSASGYYESLWRFPNYEFVEAIGMAAALQGDVYADGIVRKLSEVAEAAGVNMVDD